MNELFCIARSLHQTWQISAVFKLFSMVVVVATGVKTVGLQLL